MAQRKRGREPPPVSLTPSSSRDEIVAWLQADVNLGGAGIPEDVVEKLSQAWLDRDEGVDGSTILHGSVESLMEVGFSRTVAQRITTRVRQLGGPSTQALAPPTQPHHSDMEEQHEEGGRQQRRGRREPGRRPPATQATQMAATPMDQDSMEEGPADQPAQPVLIKRDPEDVEAEALEAQQQQQQQQQQARQRQGRRLSGVRVKAEPVGGGGDAGMPTAGEEEEEEEEEEHDAEEREEGTEDEDPPRQRGRRSTRSAKTEPVEGAVGGTAVQEHSLGLTGTRGRRVRSENEGEVRQQEGSPPQQQQQQDEAGPSSGRRLTRAQQRREEEQSARRELRARTMLERQRRDEADEAQQSDEEEDEGVPPADEEEQQQWGPRVTEDLGPEAERGQYVRDWKKRAKQGMVEIFSAMTLQELRDLVEEQEEWPELARNILRKKKRVDGVMEWVDLDKPRAIAPRLANFILTGDVDGKEDEEGAGGMRKEDIKQLLRGHCDEAARSYVEDVLKLRYQNVPRYTDPHKLMWHLWHYPEGPADDVFETLLGRRELPYEALVGPDNLEANPQTGFSSWKRVYEAVASGRLRLKDQDEAELWLTHVNDLSTHIKCRVKAKLIREPDNRRLLVYLYQTFSKDSLSSSLLAGTWTRKSPENHQEEVVAVDLRFVLSFLDGFDGSPFMQAVDGLCTQYEATEQEVTGRGVDAELPLETPMNLKQFDKVMACIEDVDGGEPQGFKEECDRDFLLTLRAYQRRSLAHMLREERAVGGSSRHLWVKLNLPEHPDLHAYFSPILHQIRISTSRIEAEQWVHATGGAGWIALQMGMGKTACAVGAIQKNPPPPGWRANRSYQKLRRRDHLSSVKNNMPHGGTLIVMPPTLIDQWEQEIRKTTDAELSILKWTESSRLHPRTQDCKEIASHDIVLTTFQNASTLHTLSHIYWWRIVADEPQLNAGGFLADRDHPWFAQHRWLLTGTPVNATVDSMGTSLQFLKLGTYDTLYSLFPPVICHVLKKFMVRYTKQGQLDGETNLDLPPLTERSVECELNAQDEQMYRSLRVEQRQAFHGLLARHHVDPNCVGGEDPSWEESGKGAKIAKQTLKFRGMLTKLRQAASSALKQPTGEELYDDERGEYVAQRHWYESKAEAVIEVLEDKDPEEKVLIFSEFPDTLRAIKNRLPTIGLQSRNLIGASSAAARGKAIREFQTDPPTKVFLLTYRAGGAGITLTAGTHIILCEPTLNPSFERQAIGRSHRMGQDKALTVTRMLMRGTVEEQVKEFAQRQTQHEAEDPEEALESTAMEANLAANDGTNRLKVEELRDFIYRMPGEDD